MWWTKNEEILAIEIMKYMWRSYQDYLDTPYAILIRMQLESKNN